MKTMLRLFNNCGKHAVEALRYLAHHERPSGGEQHFNMIDLIDTAHYLERELQRLGSMVLGSKKRLVVRRKKDGKFLSYAGEGPLGWSSNPVEALDRSGWVELDTTICYQDPKDCEVVEIEVYATLTGKKTDDFFKNGRAKGY
ncbi:hypothetical protein HJA82_29335 [Rhizobium bangladeshense]|uniref:hypothetical protein n=1 Tax=Rhizobium bangladeshense TaxID=1138189 RepID=UPI001C834F68|nr:hypothetical protein [Rhizobium bangladeshense]MBX4911419.1 hypothetical protein [Rhizobium bangladeshense]